MTYTVMDGSCRPAVDNQFLGASQETKKPPLFSEGQPERTGICTASAGRNRQNFFPYFFPNKD